MDDSYNVRFPISFDDGVEWNIWVSRLCGYVTPRKALDMVTANEVETLDVLRAGRVKVLCARILPMSATLSKNKSKIIGHFSLRNLAGLIISGFFIDFEKGFPGLTGLQGTDIDAVPHPHRIRNPRLHH